MLVRDDTIAAIASPPGGGLRGIVRVSGPATESIWRGFCTPLKEDAGNGPRVVPVIVRLPPPWPVIAARVCWWPGPRSYTRQPVAEWHVPGSPPLLDAILAAVCQLGARLAEPGEFTLRAYLSGRIDLTHAEAVLGVIDARSRRELDQALEQLAGGLAGPLRELRHRLLHTLAELEAGLDFVEEDIEFVSARQLHDSVAASCVEVERLRARLQARGSSGGLPRVVLLGLPNAGKSSLWNALVGDLGADQAALVADRPGTTRDYLEREVEFLGRRCLLIDTAGREPLSANGSIADGSIADGSIADDPIAAAAQEATRRQGGRAELRVICRDAAAMALSPAMPLRALPAAANALLHKPLGEWEFDDNSQLLVGTKADLLATVPPASELEVWVSSRTGTGLADLRRMIAERLERLTDAESSVVAGTAIRCQESLRRAAESLARAAALARIAAGLTDERETATSDLAWEGELAAQGALGRDEYIAAELRLALDALGQVAGAVHSEDILDVVFSRFCIGK